MNVKVGDIVYPAGDKDHKFVVTLLESNIINAGTSNYIIVSLTNIASRRNHTGVCLTYKDWVIDISIPKRKLPSWW